MYSDVIGRFLQRDPAGFMDGYNLYAYVRNNPMVYTDPDGQIPLWVGTGLIGGGIGLVAGGVSAWLADEDPGQIFAGAIGGAVGGFINWFRYGNYWSWRFCWCDNDRLSSGRCLYKHGNPRIRHMLLEAVWRMFQFQPDYKPIKHWKKRQANEPP